MIQPNWTLKPHWVFPGFQWLPLPARAAVSRRWPYGHVRSEASPPGAAVRDVTQALRSYAEYHLERPLKSLQLLAV